MRRCVCHHLPFPPFSSAVADAGSGGAAVSVERIVQSRLGVMARDENVCAAVGLYRAVREQLERVGGRAPSLAELLNFVEYLQQLQRRACDGVQRVALCIPCKRCIQCAGAVVWRSIPTGGCQPPALQPGPRPQRW